MGTVDTKLVGTAGDGPQRQLGNAVTALQYRKLRAGGFSFLVYITQETGQWSAGNGGINDALICLRTAEHQRVVGFWIFSSV